MVDDASATYPTRAFIVGCPRSGTTWLQLLLDRHPDVVTAPETQIFAYYLVHFRRQWEHEHDGAAARNQGGAGLSRLLDHEAFDELCRRSADFVLDRIASHDPDADVVLEKSPLHALYVDWIRRLYPEARFIHVIRDPRDTVSSLIAAGWSWGSGWAPRNVIDAARLWNDNVRSARSLESRPDAYREVRYEGLNADAESVLGDVLGWLGLSADREFCRDAVRACELERVRNRARKERDADDSSTGLPLPGRRSPEGFFRRGRVGGWREDLSDSDVRIVEHLCADLMDELGYEPLSGGRGRRPIRIPLHDVLQRVREGIDWQLQKLLFRV